jgi:hypothetical protein
MAVVTENTRKLFTEAGRDRHLARYYTARHDRLHALYFDKASWDDTGRDGSLYAYCTQNVHCCKFVLGRLNT